MHLSSFHILIYDVFYMFQNRGFIFRKTVVCTGMVQYSVVHTYISISILVGSKLLILMHVTTYMVLYF